LHRDIKLANIYLTSTNLDEADIRLGDFGVAKELIGDLTKTKCGTPLYEAPEIREGEHGFGVDVWSLGVCFYEMMVGPNPFRLAKTIDELQ
jgi:protein kinase